MSAFDPNSNDVFRTQTDQRFNTFADPMNSVNTNPGDWGIDPSYLTPAHLSPYRPHYQGSTGDNFGQFKPGFWSSLNQVANPLAGGGDNYGGNYTNQTSPFYDALSQKPMDTAMSFSQKWAVPAAMGWAGYKFLGDASTKMGENFAGNLIGKGLLANGPPTKAAVMAIRAGRFTGGMVAGAVIPAMAVQAGVSAVDKAIFDPYIAQSNMRNDLRQNFQGVSYGTESGDRFTGSGISREIAASISKDVSMTGAMDKTFNQHETSQLVDYASRAGLMDNASPDQMAKRFESVIKQVKMVMSVANTSDFRETIEIMAKLRQAGVTDKQLPATLGSLASAAGAAGQSVQKMMNTVGLQGQYMFGQAGMTSYVGQQVAFGANAAMASAYRSGLMSPALAARMGGVEGATQSSVGATIAMANTPYASFKAFNAYQGQGEAGTVVGNLSRFGGAMARNPLETIGQYQMTRNAAASKYVSDRGITGEHDQIVDIARTLPNGIGKNGKVGSGTAYSILTQTMGMTQEQAVAKMMEFAAINDDKSFNSSIEGSNAAGVKSLLDYQRQQGLNKGVFSTPVNAVLKQAYGVQRTGARLVGGMNEKLGAFGDALQSKVTGAMFDLDPGEQIEGLVEDKDETEKNPDKAPQTIKQLNKGSNEYIQAAKLYASNLLIPQKDTRDLISSVDPFGAVDWLGGKLGAKYQGNAMDIAFDTDNADKISKIAGNKNHSLNKIANIALDPKSSKKDRINAMFNLSQNNAIDSSYTDEASAKRAVDIIDFYGTKDTKETVRGTNQDVVADNIDKATKNVKGEFKDKLEYISLSDKIFKQLKDPSAKRDPKDVERYAALTGQKVEDLNDAALLKQTGESEKNINELRLGYIVGDSAKDMKELTAKHKKSGMAILSPTIHTGDDIEAGVMERESLKAGATDRAKLRQLKSQGLIDTNTMMAGFNSLDNKDTVGKFASAVDDFGKAVNVLAGKSPSTESSSPVTGFFGSAGDAVLNLRNSKVPSKR